MLLKLDEKVAVVTMANGIDVNASGLAQRAYQLMAPALKAAQSDSTWKTPTADASLGAYLGTYASSFGGEVEVIRWEGGLATISLPTDNPVRAITKFRKVGDHTFKRIRDDGELAEAMSFDLGTDGRATRLRVNYNISPRIR